MDSEPVDGSVTMNETITELNNLRAAERASENAEIIRSEIGDAGNFESPF